MVYGSIGPGSVQVVCFNIKARWQLVFVKTCWQIGFHTLLNARTVSARLAKGFLFHRPM